MKTKRIIDELIIGFSTCGLTCSFCDAVKFQGMIRIMLLFAFTLTVIRMFIKEE